MFPKSFALDMIGGWRMEMTINLKLLRALSVYWNFQVRHLRYLVSAF